MGSVFFAFGSAIGAAITCFVVRGKSHWSTAFALNGIVCGLLGALFSATGNTSTRAIIESGSGFLATAVPLTLCISGLRAVSDWAGVFSPRHHLATALGLTLVSGLSCATVGFVAVKSVHNISIKESRVNPLGYPVMMSLWLFRAPGTASRGRL